MHILPEHNGSIMINQDNKSYIKHGSKKRQIFISSDSGQCELIDSGEQFFSTIEAYMFLNNTRDISIEPTIINSNHA